MNNEHTNRGQFVAGEVTPGGGRPKGARNVLSRSLIEDLAAEWAEGGRDALRVMRKEKPDKFVAAALAILPRDVLVSIEQKPGSQLYDMITSLSPDGMRAIAEAMQLLGKLGPRGVELLRAEAAKLVAGHTESPPEIATDDH
jgi:hypothetical protein